MLMVAMAALSSQADPEINVGGVEVTSSNASHITGGDITSGYGVYNESTNTLTLYNISIRRSGQDNYGIHNRGCDNLTIVFSGGGTIAASDNALKLMRSTTIKVTSGSVDLISAARIAVNLKSYNYYFEGDGELVIQTYKDAYEAIKGNGISSTKVYFRGPKVWAISPSRSALSSFSAYFQGGDLTIRSNGSDPNVSDVSMSFSGKEAILSPYGAYYSNNTIYNSSGSVIKDKDIYISDNYVAMINSTNFPDANFRQWMLNSYSKGYITQSDVDSRTALYCNGNSISSLTGVEYFNKLIELYCHNNNLTTLRDLPSTLQTINCSSNKFSGTLVLNNRSALKSLNVSNNTGLTTLYCTSNALTSLDVSGCTALTTLNCYGNQLTSLPSLPTSVKSLAIGANKFTTLSITGRSNLQLLDVNSSNLLTSLTCSGNALTTLNVTGCSALTTLDCKSNQLTSLGTLPTSLQTIDCSSNKLSGMLSLTGRSALKSLNVSNNASLTQLYCYSNALTSLNMNSCSALTTLDCHSNQLTSLALPASQLQTIDCSSNKFTSLTITGRSALKSLNVRNNTSMTTLHCSSNALISLGISGCTALTSLDCSSNQLTSLDVSANSNLEELKCPSNELVSLNVQGLTKLKNFTCANNKLTSLSVQGCTALSTQFNITTNQIKGEALTSLINSMYRVPSGVTAKFQVFNQDNTNEGNAITDEQIRLAQGKNWHLYKYYNGGWEELNPSAIRGDVTGDSKVDIEDVNATINIILDMKQRTDYPGNADLTGDNKVDIEDVNAIINIILTQ